MAQPRVGLLFDLDGTLVDSAAGIASALSTILRERGGSAVGPEVVRPMVSLGADALVRGALGEHARDTAQDLAAFRAVLRELAPDPASVFPGVRKALADFTTAGYPMAIVTNKPEGLSRALLQDLNLIDYFSAIVGGDTAANSKPDPAPVILALARIGVASDRAMFIGDSEVDAGAALACRIPFLLYEGGYGALACHSDHVHARFDDFSQLSGLIASAFDDVP
jgi:phosphoglycolate phosphatase